MCAIGWSASHRSALLLLALTAATPVATYAADDIDAKSDATQPLEEVIVFGRGEALIGKADAASEGAVGGADLAVRPLLRVAELLEVVPGLIAAQHSGSGKANQYFLRGFQLDHGTDFTTYFDDVPLNLRTHGHGQGYLDVNGLIPEVVERIDYRKGPYRADIGDFALAGASFMTTVNNLTPFAAVEAGGYGWQRVAGGGTVDLGPGRLTAAAQWKTYDGPWELPEDLNHKSLWGKYSQPTDFGTWNVSLSGYEATWHPTEQAPESSFGTAACANEYCSLDKTAFGKTVRWIASTQLLADNWRATGYAQYYDWHMLSDSTYDYQINQFDRRLTFGGRYERSLVKSDKLAFNVGTEIRYDDISNVGFNHTDAGTYQNTVAQNAVDEGSIGVYSEVTWTPIKDLRLMGGLRDNYYNFDVTAKTPVDENGNNPSANGTDSDQQLSPKLGAAYSLNDNVELYANWGKGFHSNDARGVLNAETPVPGLVTGKGYETGARFEVGDFKVTAAYWWLNLSSELIFVGDSNAVEPKGGSRRHGYEIVAFWRPFDWLGIDSVYARSHARYRDIQEDGGYDIEGSVRSAGELGFSAIKGAWELSARLRYLGKYPLVPNPTNTAVYGDAAAGDGLIADAETMLNLRGAYRWEHLTLYAELLNAFNDHGKDVTYYYDTYIPGVSAVGTEQADRLSRAEEPRTLRWGVKYEF